MTAVADLPLRLVTLRDPAVQADPYPFYHRLRAEDPVHWEEGTTLALNRWVVTRYADVAAANRDPAQYAAPDRLDLGRGENRHLAFAYGPHFCLGAALARMEGQIALGTMLRRWPHLRLATSEVQWRDNVILRGLVALPVFLDEAQP